MLDMSVQHVGFCTGCVECPTWASTPFAFQSDYPRHRAGNRDDTESVRNARRGRTVALHGGRQWRNLRLRILMRDGYRCQINGLGCTTVADQVDHIKRLSEGGAKYDPNNLRAACNHCNASDGARHGNKMRSEPRTLRWR